MKLVVEDETREVERSPVVQDLVGPGRALSLWSLMLVSQ